VAKCGGAAVPGLSPEGGRAGLARCRVPVGGNKQVFTARVGRSILRLDEHPWAAGTGPVALSTS
jgi:hypothetical protein